MTIALTDSQYVWFALVGREIKQDISSWIIALSNYPRRDIFKSIKVDY